MTRKIEFIDLRTQQTRIKKSLDARMAKVLSHGQYIMGPEISELEKQLSEFTGAKHSILCSSGTDALMMALFALNVGPGDEVITTPFTFFATGEMVALLGAKPVFCDIDLETYNLDPRNVEAKITSKTKAIVPVNLYGQCVDYDVFNALGKRHGIPVIEDAAQSFGASFNGKRSGSLGTIGCTSFFPAKPLGCYGDAGACFTQDDALALKMRQFLNHGQETRYYHVSLGINGRCDTLQAAILQAKMEVFEDELKARDRIAKRYNEKIQSALGTKVQTPIVKEKQFSAWAQYTIAVDNRDAVIKKLNEQGVPTSIHYPRPLHLQKAFEFLGYNEGAFPKSEACGKRVLSLPMHPYLENDDQDFIVDSLKKALT